MPRHRLDLTITDRESVAERVKRFLAGIEQPLVSIELTGQNRAWSFYGFYQVGRSIETILLPRLSSESSLTPSAGDDRRPVPPLGLEFSHGNGFCCATPRHAAFPASSSKCQPAPPALVRARGFAGLVQPGHVHLTVVSAADSGSSITRLPLTEIGGGSATRGKARTAPVQYRCE